MMSLKAVLFDLDGTLLPMDQEVFIKDYFSRLAQTMAKKGYEPKKLVAAVWDGSMAMIKNSGEKKNEQVFWDCFAAILGEEVRKEEPTLHHFYETEFQKVQSVCGFDPLAKPTVDALKAMGLRVILATNPIFPKIATESRARWAGLDLSDFELTTTYENSTSCKPNLHYYREILEKCGLAPEECLMVGNDVGDDMVVRQMGMDSFLLTRDLINKENTDISVYPRGDLNDLLSYIKSL